MKNLILTFMLIGSSCAMSTSKISKEEIVIEKVAISYFGGMSIYLSQDYVITKDSVYFSRTSVDTSLNKNWVSAHPSLETWNGLVDRIHFDHFKSIENGPTHQTYDGNDISISIWTTNDSIAIINGEEDSLWNDVLNYIHRNYKNEE